MLRICIVIPNAHYSINKYESFFIEADETQEQKISKGKTYVLPFSYLIALKKTDRCNFILTNTLENVIFMEISNLNGILYLSPGKQY